MKLENRFFLTLKHQEIRFLKRVIFRKSLIVLKNPKIPFKFEKRFFQAEKFSKSERVPFDWIKNFRKKVHCQNSEGLFLAYWENS